MEVGDRDAKRNAVNKILRDYPDIDINPIKDPAGALQLAKQVIDDKLVRYQKTLNFLLLFALIFALTFLMSLGISNNINFENLINNNSKSWAEKNVIAKGYNPYSILNVMCHIQLSDTIGPNKRVVRRAYFRYFYTLKAAKEITADENVFEEQYLTNSATIIPWAGTEHQEVESISDHRYWVKFAAKKGEILTVGTGANYVYDSSHLSHGSTGCFGNLQLVDTDWFTCYPNTNDYIDKITIIVEAQNFDILQLPGAAYRKSPNGAVTSQESICKIFSNDKKCTLVAIWTNLGPGECVGLKVGCRRL